MAQIAWLRPSTPGEHDPSKRACRLRTPLVTRHAAVMAIQWLVHTCTVPPVRVTSHSCGSTDTAAHEQPGHPERAEDGATVHVRVRQRRHREGVWQHVHDRQRVGVRLVQALVHDDHPELEPQPQRQGAPVHQLVDHVPGGDHG